MPDAAEALRARLRPRLDEGLSRLGGPAAALDEGVRGRLVDFVVLLAKWNRVHNLTAVREPLAMLDRHVLDSLALLPWFAEATTPRAAALYDLIDVGSGGGLPVLPLAVARPALACLSVETNGKKVRFQRQAALELGLAGVEVRHVRVESLDARARTVVSRAFAAPGDFLTAAARLCTPGGRALVMLGHAERLPEPLPDPFTLGGLHALDVPFASGPRHVAVCHTR